MKTKWNSYQNVYHPQPVALHKLLPVASLTIALVAGCSSSSDDDPPVSTDEALVGFVSVEVEQDGDTPETEVAAGFFRFEDTMFIDDFFDALDTRLEGGDICIVSGDAQDESALDFEFDFDFGETVSAGETLTLTSPSATYATLERQSVDSPIDGSTLIFYALPEGATLPGLPPSGLIVDIPGDVFPAFSNVAVPDLPAPLTDFSPAIDATVSATTTFAWTPSAVSNAGIVLEIGNETESIDCLLVDDGDFTLPASITAQLADPFAGSVLEADREAFDLLRSGDALLYVLVEDGRGD